MQPSLSSNQIIANNMNTRYNYNCNNHHYPPPIPQNNGNMNNNINHNVNYHNSYQYQQPPIMPLSAMSNNRNTMHLPPIPAPTQHHNHQIAQPSQPALSQIYRPRAQKRNVSEMMADVLQNEVIQNIYNPFSHRICI